MQKLNEALTLNTEKNATYTYEIKLECNSLSSLVYRLKIIKLLKRLYKPEKMRFVCGAVSLHPLQLGLLHAATV